MQPLTQEATRHFEKVQTDTESPGSVLKSSPEPQERTGRTEPDTSQTPKPSPVVNPEPDVEKGPGNQRQVVYRTSQAGVGGHFLYPRIQQNHDLHRGSDQNSIPHRYLRPKYCGGKGLCASGHLRLCHRQQPPAAGSGHQNRLKRRRKDVNHYT